MEFTVEDLAAFSGVILNTVRVVLARHESFVEHVRTQDNGQRGGQFKIYRVRHERLEQLRSMINDAYTNLLPPSVDPSNAKEVPISLRAAEDVLRRRFPQEQDLAQKQKLFDLAEVRIESARQEIGLLVRQLPQQTGELLRFRLQSAESLLGLCQDEMALAMGTKPIEEVDVIAILKNFKALADKFTKNGDNGDAAALLGRVVESPVLTAAVGQTVYST